MSTTNKRFFILLLLTLLAAFHLLIILGLGDHFKSRSVKRAGHDWSQFYYARLVVVSVADALNSPDQFRDKLQRNLKLNFFVSEGVPAVIALKALCFVITGHDYTLPTSDYSTGDSYNSFQAEYFVYFAIMLTSVFFIYKTFRLYYSMASAATAAVLLLTSVQTAYWTYGWKHYVLPGMFFLSVALFFFFKYFSGETHTNKNLKNIFYFGCFGGLALMSNPKIIIALISIMCLLFVYKMIFFKGKLQNINVLSIFLMSLLGVALFPVLHDLLIFSIFSDPTTRFEWPWDNFSWYFLSGLGSWAKAYTDAGAQKFIETWAVSFPTYFLRYFCETEGALSFVVYLAAGAYIGYLNYYEIVNNKSASTVPDFGKALFSGYLVFMAAIAPLIFTLFLEFSSYTGFFYTGRTFYLFLFFALLLPALTLDGFGRLSGFKKLAIFGGLAIIILCKCHTLYKESTILKQYSLMGSTSWKYEDYAKNSKELIIKNFKWHW